MVAEKFTDSGQGPGAKSDRCVTTHVTCDINNMIDESSKGPGAKSDRCVTCHVTCNISDMVQESSKNDRSVFKMMPIVALIKMDAQAPVNQLFSEVASRFSYELGTFDLKMRQKNNELGLLLSDYYDVLLEEAGFAFSKFFNKANALSVEPKAGKSIGITDTSDGRFKDFIPFELMIPNDSTPLSFSINSDATVAMLETFSKTYESVPQGAELGFHVMDMKVDFADYLESTLLGAGFKTSETFEGDLKTNKIFVQISDSQKRQQTFLSYNKGSFSRKMFRRESPTSYFLCNLLCYESRPLPAKDVSDPTYALFYVRRNAAVSDIFREVSNQFSYAMDTFELAFKQENTELMLSNYYDIPLLELGFEKECNSLRVLQKDGCEIEIEPKKKQEPTNSDTSYDLVLIKGSIGDATKLVASDRLRFSGLGSSESGPLTFVHCECNISTDTKRFNLHNVYGHSDSDENFSFYVNSTANGRMLEEFLRVKFGVPADICLLLDNGDQLVQLTKPQSLLTQGFESDQKNKLLLREFCSHPMRPIAHPVDGRLDVCCFVTDNSSSKEGNLYFIVHLSALTTWGRLRSEVAKFYEYSCFSFNLFRCTEQGRLEDVSGDDILLKLNTIGSEDHCINLCVVENGTKNLPIPTEEFEEKYEKAFCSISGLEMQKEWTFGINYDIDVFHLIRFIELRLEMAPNSISVVFVRNEERVLLNCPEKTLEELNFSSSDTEVNKLIVIGDIETSEIFSDCVLKSVRVEEFFVPQMYFVQMEGASFSKRTASHTISKKEESSGRIVTVYTYDSSSSRVDNLVNVSYFDSNSTFKNIFKRMGDFFRYEADTFDLLPVPNCTCRTLKDKFSLFPLHMYDMESLYLCIDDMGLVKPRRIPESAAIKSKIVRCIIMNKNNPERHKFKLQVNADCKSNDLLLIIYHRCFSFKYDSSVSESLTVTFNKSGKEVILSRDENLTLEKLKFCLVEENELYFTSNLSLIPTCLFLNEDPQPSDVNYIFCIVYGRSDSDGVCCMLKFNAQKTIQELFKEISWRFCIRPRTFDVLLMKEEEMVCLDDSSSLHSFLSEHGFRLSSTQLNVNLLAVTKKEGVSYKTMSKVWAHASDRYTQYKQAFVDISLQEDVIPEMVPTFFPETLQVNLDATGTMFTMLCAVLFNADARVSDSVIITLKSQEGQAIQICSSDTRTLKDMAFKFSEGYEVIRVQYPMKAVGSVALHFHAFLSYKEMVENGRESKVEDEPDAHSDANDKENEKTWLRGNQFKTSSWHAKYDEGTEIGSGFVGLVNQAMTCYLNSLLQTLYMTPEFRNALYRWEFDGSEDDGTKSIPYQLQKLFLLLQTCDKSAIKTTELTKSFGWDSSQAWQQHDIQELCRIMFDALEQKFKNTEQADLINTLYEGRMKDYVKCLECCHENAREDTFLDVPLVVRPFGSTKAVESVEEALHAFVTPETLNGSNQYFCERCNKKCDAHKGLRFIKFPYLLTLHLKRFDFDYSTMHRIKLNDRVEFPKELDLNDFANPNIINDLTRFNKKNPKGVYSNKWFSFSREYTEKDHPSECSKKAKEAVDLLAAEMRAHRKRGVGGEQLMSDQTKDVSNDDNKMECYYAEGDLSPGPSDDKDQAQHVGDGDNTEQDINSSSSGKGPFIYELFSVMVHSGGANGGHYYAYIKSFTNSNWYSFNDSHVTEIYYSDVEKMFGGDTSSGYSASSFHSCANAYMLMYRQVDKEKNAEFLMPDAFPPHIKKLLQKMDDDEEEEQRQQERERRMCKFKLFCHHPVKKRLVDMMLKIDGGDSLLDATKTARTILGLDSVVPLECCRLVQYDEADKSMECSFEGAENKIIYELFQLNSGKDLYLEIKKASEEFEVYKTGGTTVKVHVVNLETEDVPPPKLILRSYLHEPVSVFKEQLGKKLEVSSETLRVVVKSKDKNPMRLLENPTESLHFCRFGKSTTVFVEYSDEKDAKLPFTQSKLFATLDVYLNSIFINVVLPKEGDVIKMLPPATEMRMKGKEKEDPPPESLKTAQDAGMEHLQERLKHCNLNVQGYVKTNDTYQDYDEGLGDSEIADNQTNDGIQPSPAGQSDQSEDSSLTDSERTLIGDELSPRENSPVFSDKERDRLSPELPGLTTSEAARPDSDSAHSSSDSNFPPEDLSNPSTPEDKELKEAPCHLTSAPVNFDDNNPTLPFAGLLRRKLRVFPCDDSETTEKSLRVYVDKRMTNEDFKQGIQPHVGFEMDSFRMYRKVSNKQEILMYNPNENFENFTSDCKIVIKLEKILSEDKFTVKVFQLHLNVAEPMKHLISTVFTKGMTVLDAKKLILHELKKANILEVPLNRCRFRMKSWKNPGCVFLNHQKFHVDINVNFSWELLLQVLPGEEPVTSPNQPILNIRRWHSSTNKLDLIEEVITETNTLKSTIKKISEVSTIPEEHLRIRVSSNNFPSPLTLTDVKASWLGLDEPSIDSPVHDMGRVVFYRDDREVVKDLTEEELSLLQDSPTRQAGGSKRVVKKPTYGEKALKFYNLDNETDKTEVNQEGSLSLQYPELD